MLPENDFLLISDWLADWENAQIDQDRIEQLTCQACKRFGEFLFLKKSNPAFKWGSGDFAGLLRHYMGKFRFHHPERYQYTEIKLPPPPGFPDSDLLKIFSMNTLHIDANGYRRIDLKEWNPEWFIGNSDGRSLDVVFSDKMMRPDFTVPIDPSIGKLRGFDTYRSKGQRDAVRSYLNAPLGSSLVVTLPTGTGKTLLTQLAVLMAEENAGLTIVVVPTISLALDQEAEFRKIPGFESHKAAYYSGLSPEQRSSIRQAIRSGKQRIIFTSPESLLNSLLFSLYEAAYLGLINDFIIDEAHMVNEWGDDFRPYYQLLGALREKLLSLTPDGREFKSLYMTATLTVESYKVLNIFFNNGKALPIVWGNYIRTEPVFWLAGKCKDLEEKKIRLKEILAVAPRPFILYISKPDEKNNYNRVLTADDCMQIMDELKIKRVRKFTGQTPDDEREEIIGLWKSNQIDCVVANSAFGVGMNKSDIRAVIHACIPENINRFYQEVGRGGRDGFPCLSFLLYDDADLKFAESLARVRVLDEQLLPRWIALLLKATHISQQVYELNLVNSLPVHINQKSDMNTDWNLKALLLMQRAGLLSVMMPEISKLKTESYSAFGVEKSIHLQKILIKVNGEVDLTADSDVWNDNAAIAQTRKTMINYADDGFQKLNKLLNGGKDFFEAFQRTYSGIYEQVPDGFCSGCPSCGYNFIEHRLTESDPFVYMVESSLQVGNLADLGIKDESAQFFILYSENDIENIPEFVKILLSYTSFDEIYIQDMNLLDHIKELSSELGQRAIDLRYTPPEFNDGNYEQKITLTILNNYKSLPSVVSIPRQFHLIIIPQEIKEERDLEPVIRNQTLNIRAILEREKEWVF